EIVAVRQEVIREALAARVVPVIAPVLWGEVGGFFNSNADRAAGAIAAAIGADQVIFLTDVPGVLQEGQQLERVTQAEAKSLMASGVVKGGMAVKLGAALDALSAGVKRATVTNLEGLGQGIGTIVAI